MGVKLQYLDTEPYTRRSGHGIHVKDMMVLHETVSPDQAGLADIKGVEAYLQKIGYGIHGMTDLEGHAAWSYGQGNDVFWHCGGVNERSCGIEQVSYIPELLAKGSLTMAQAKAHWAQRMLQLQATAKVIACWHNANSLTRPLVYSVGTTPGITTHWDVSQIFPASEGHTDCHPVHKGGYYPVLEVIQLAKGYAALGYHF